MSEAKTLRLTNEAREKLRAQAAGGGEVVLMAAKLAALLDENERLREALEFYADPDSYFAVSVLADSPAGAFSEDFDANHGHPDYDREMPGTRARAALAGSDSVKGAP